MSVMQDKTDKIERFLQKEKACVTAAHAFS